MKVGTDFSGIGAPEMALKYLGIEFESVFACEIDKFARQSFEQLHNPIKFYNDITTRNHKEVEQLDLYVAGFPCQAFSMAGKRKGFDEARGTLFFNVAEFIKENNPKTFILENVKGLLSHDNGKTFQTIVDILSNGGGTQNGQIRLDVFDDGLGYHIYWQVLNTKHYGIPQNRERIFIVGFKYFREFSFPKPIELKLRLGDMLQDNPKSFNLIDGFNSFNKIKYIDNKICGTITQHQSRSGITNGFKIQSDVSIKVEDKYYLSDKLIQSFTNHKERHTEKGTGFKWEVKKKDDVANCLRANASLCPTDKTIITHSLHPRSSKTGKGGTGHLSKKDGTAYCLDTSNAQAIELNKKIRRLTPLECWRLQGFKDEDFFSVKDVSDTQLYKQAGNSITVNVLMELFKKIYADYNK
tara:strand:+ start:51 stop:1283 length:1233 start_codon:yes stop_codon:yes gene_type:complete